MFLKVKSRRFPNGPLVDIRKALPQFAPEDWLEVTRTPDGLDLYDLLLTRSLALDPLHTPHYLTYICQHLYHNDLSTYLVDQQSDSYDHSPSASPSPSPADAFLSPIRGLRLVRDLFDADTLDLHVAAHAALAFALRSAAAEYFVNAHSARDLFDAVAECALALNSSGDFDFQRASGAHSHDLFEDRSREAEPERAWRLERELLDNIAPSHSPDNCSSTSSPLLNDFNVNVSGDSNETQQNGLLLLLRTDRLDRPLQASSFIDARLVFDARTLAPHTNASSGVRTLRRPLTILVDSLPSSAALLLRLSLIVAFSPKVELLGPFNIVCQRE